MFFTLPKSKTPMSSLPPAKPGYHWATKWVTRAGMRWPTRVQVPNTVSGAAMTRTQISKPEYALLTVAVAQRLTGSSTATPTARQLAEAQKQAQAAILKAGVGVRGGTTKIDHLFNKARNQLSGITGMGDDECGSLWDSIKDAIVKSAPIMPFLGPATGLVPPTAAIIMSQRAKAGKKAPPKAAPAPAAAPAETSASTDDNSQLVSAGDDLTDTLIYGEDLTDTLIYGNSSAGESITSTYDRAIARLSGDDELIYGEGGGATEAAAAQRRSNRPYYFPPTMASGASDISPKAYRLAVLQRAAKISGGRRPSTKAMFVAQKTVDRDLASGGMNVRVPGAHPGRVTR